MPFQQGSSGNPKGRPSGTLTKHAKMRQLLESRADELISKCVDLALSGDVNALRLCIERLIPRAKDEPVTISLTSNTMPSEVLKSAALEILNKLEIGAVTPEQAKLLFSILREYREGEVALDLYKKINEIKTNLQLTI